MIHIGPISSYNNTRENIWSRIAIGVHIWKNTKLLNWHFEDIKLCDYCTDFDEINFRWMALHCSHHLTSHRYSCDSWERRMWQETKNLVVTGCAEIRHFSTNLTPCVSHFLVISRSPLLTARRPNPNLFTIYARTSCSNPNPDYFDYSNIWDHRRHFSRWRLPSSFKSNANELWLHSWRHGVHADELDDDMISVAFNSILMNVFANCVSVGLPIASGQAAAPPTCLQPNLSDDFVKLGDFVIMNT